MAISPLPASLQQLGGGRFAFYPPIRNVEHNEWIYRRATWSEVVVVNTGTGSEFIIPRTHIGNVSLGENPDVIVGLRSELEYREGIVRVWHRPVIELPVAVNQGAAPIAHHKYPAEVVSIRLEEPRETRLSLKLAVGVMLGAIGCLIGANVVHSHVSPGLPSTHSVQASDGRIYRLIRYPGRNSIVVLDAQSHYLGTMDLHRRVVDAVTLPDGKSAGPLLLSLPAF
jgi:hypothetical protein